MKHWRARRPRDSSLDTTKARNTLKTRFHDTSLAVKIFSEEWRKTRGDNTQKHG